MRNVKFSFILPLVQLCVAISLFEWALRIPGPLGLDTFYVPTPRLLCFGINAPAVLFRIPILLLMSVSERTHSALEHPLAEFSVLGLSASELSFLVGVVVLWFLVGRMLDHHSSSTFHERSRMTVFSVLLELLVMSMGVLLFVAAVHSFSDPWLYNNMIGNRAQGILFLAWSLVLVILPILNFVRAIRSKPRFPARDVLE
jgi:hypothetical protein